MSAIPPPQSAPPDRSGIRGQHRLVATGLDAASRASAVAALAALAATRRRRPVSGTSARVGWRGGWVVLVVSCLARAALTMLASLLLWSLLPVALGWHTTVVMSGSMEPRLHTGDVVVSRPVPSDQLRVGQVVLVDDPDEHGRLRLHRLAAIRADGTLTLRGDANAANDSSPVARSAVHGVASLRVPSLGAPEYWLQTRDYRALVLLAAALAGLVAAALAYRGDDIDPTDDGDTAAPAEPPASSDPIGGGSNGGTGAGRDHRLRHGSQRAGRLTVVGLLAVTLSAGTLVTAGPAQAAGKFSRTAANGGNSWAAATYFTCANAAINDGARFAWPLSETSGTTADDITANALNGTYSSTGVGYGAAGPCNGKSATTLNGTTGTVSLSATASLIPDVSFEVWFKASGAHGGSLMSITSGTTTTMAMAMTSTGTLTLAISAIGIKTVSTTTAFNDNQWHLAVGVIGGSGMALYVDNRAPVTSSAVTSAATAIGTPRVGYANHLNLGTGSYDYFQGSVAYAALYKLTLTATQVINHYNAA